ncbi:hypothetical protein HDU88_001304 [Geranomyces variabilis]|nr:hypothetical protein HDU88_001304 [Geranomyces variabilis]
MSSASADNPLLAASSGGGGVTTALRSSSTAGPSLAHFHLASANNTNSTRPAAADHLHHHAHHRNSSPPASYQHHHHHHHHHHQQHNHDLASSRPPGAFTQPLPLHGHGATAGPFGQLPTLQPQPLLHPPQREQPMVSPHSLPHYGLHQYQQQEPPLFSHPLPQESPSPSPLQHSHGLSSLNSGHVTPGQSPATTSLPLPIPPSHHQQHYHASPPTPTATQPSHSIGHTPPLRTLAPPPPMEGSAVGNRLSINYLMAGDAGGSSSAPSSPHEQHDDEDSSPYMQHQAEPQQYAPQSHHHQGSFQSLLHSTSQNHQQQQQHHAPQLPSFHHFDGVVQQFEAGPHMHSMPAHHSGPGPHAPQQNQLHSLDLHAPQPMLPHPQHQQYHHQLQPHLPQQTHHSLPFPALGGGSAKHEYMPPSAPSSAPHKHEYMSTGSSGQHLLMHEMDSPPIHSYQPEYALAPYHQQAQQQPSQHQSGSVHYVSSQPPATQHADSLPYHYSSGSQQQQQPQYHMTSPYRPYESFDHQSPVLRPQHHHYHNQGSLPPPSLPLPQPSQQQQDPLRSRPSSTSSSTPRHAPASLPMKSERPDSTASSSPQHSDAALPSTEPYQHHHPGMMPAAPPPTRSGTSPLPEGMLRYDPHAFKHGLMHHFFDSKEPAIEFVKEESLKYGFSVLVRTSKPDYVVVICNCGRRLKRLKGERKRNRRFKTAMTGCEWRIVLFRSGNQKWEFRATPKMEHNHGLPCLSTTE